jgi:Holliday junction resolvase
MANPNKQKGDKAERDVAYWFNDHGWQYAERARNAGQPKDRGDIVGIPGFCIQVKDRGTIRLREWVDGTLEQKENARADTGLLIAKRRGVSDVGRWYAVLEVEDVNRLMLEADGRWPLETPSTIDGGFA